MQSYTLTVKYVEYYIFLGNLVTYGLISYETLAHVFSCEFCDISKNTFFYRTPPVAASVRSLHKKWSFPLQISSTNVTKSAGKTMSLLMWKWMDLSSKKNYLSICWDCFSLLNLIGVVTFSVFVKMYLRKLQSYSFYEVSFSWGCTLVLSVDHTLLHWILFSVLARCFFWLILACDK